MFFIFAFCFFIYLSVILMLAIAEVNHSEQTLLTMIIIILPAHHALLIPLASIYGTQQIPHLQL